MRPTVPIALALCILLLVCLTPPAPAYMALIRQGADSTEVPNVGDRHGKALAAGDFNGDGYDDLAMAAPSEFNGLGPRFSHGGVVISYGSPAGLTHLGADWITVGDIGAQDALFGQALVSADFDQDGYDDLAVGIPHMDLIGPTRTNAGQVWIYFGSAGGLQLAHGTVLDQTQAGGAIAEDGDLFGWSLATGFFDADAYPDLAVGSIGEDGSAGVVFYFYGGAGGIGSGGASWSKLADLGDTNEAGSWLGYALEANDFNGDGLDDLAVGAPRKNVGSFNDAGRVYVIFSTSSGLDDQLVTTYDALGLGLDAQSGARFGWSLASGNYWVQKSTHDLAIGEPTYDHSELGVSFPDAGRAIVLRLDPPATTPQRSPKIPPSQITILVKGAKEFTTLEAGRQYGYALASGRYDNDLLDDLAVAGPYKDFFRSGSFLSNSGLVTVFPGDEINFGTLNSLTRDFTVETLNDHAIGGEKLGQALCFGRFDDSGRQALALGAPERDYEDFLDGGTDILAAGAVYILAPWRQPTNRPHRSSVVLDCDGNIAYAQRPFDLVNPASTTKALTTLLACEAMAVDPSLENYTYTVDWARQPNIGGSLVPLYFGEQMKFFDLVKTFMTRSGNDAGYAIADVLTGETATWNGYVNTLPGFAVTMNTRKTQLGLSAATNMTNPSGMDYGFDPDHHTHAMDWVELARGVMADPCVRTVVGEPCWDIPRTLPSGLQNWLALNTPQIQTQFCNGFVEGLRQDDFPATGIKPGGTPSAWYTGLGSAQGLGGEVYAAWFGVRYPNKPPGNSGGDNTATGRELLQVGRSRCEANDFAPPPPAPPGPFVTLTQIPSLLGSSKGTCFDLEAEPDRGMDPTDLELFAQLRSGSGTDAHLRIAAVRTMSATLAPTETVVFTEASLQTHEGLVLQNMGSTTAALAITASHPTGSTWVLSIAPGDSARLPAANVGGQDFVLTLTNSSSTDPVELGLYEAGLTYDVVLNATARTYGAAMTRAGGSFTTDQLCVFVAGQDALGGADVDLSVHGGSQATAVPDEGTPPEAGRSPRLQSYPNPFNPVTTLRYYVPERATVELAIYDARGRLVRVLSAGALHEAGWHQRKWEGRDGTGARVASGVYHVRLVVAGEVIHRSIALIE